MAVKSESRQKTAMIMAGGTGGHIFPGIALAQKLMECGWRVRWMGAPQSMESRIVAENGIEMDMVEFGGIRRKGALAWASLPWTLARACWQSARILRRERPAVVVGFGGYISFPGGMIAAAMGIPLALHEQNAAMGLANRVLSRWAVKVFAAFPLRKRDIEWVGNPLRREFAEQVEPMIRYSRREGPLRLLVVGGSLGAKSLNSAVPKALGLLCGKKFEVMHVSGEKNFRELEENYAREGVEARLVPFVAGMGAELARADIVVCRAGASTVAELAAVGVPALMVPYPGAVDDHQALNAKLLVDAGGGWMVRESELTPEWLAAFLGALDRSELSVRACSAAAVRRLEAVESMADACEALAR